MINLLNPTSQKNNLIFLVSGCSFDWAYNLPLPNANRHYHIGLGRPHRDGGFDDTLSIEYFLNHDYPEESKIALRDVITKEGLVVIEKPSVSLVGIASSLKSDLRRARKILHKTNPYKAEEMCKRVLDSWTYAQAMHIIREYVTVL